jgi:hypothetical protein
MPYGAVAVRRTVKTFDERAMRPMRLLLPISVVNMTVPRISSEIGFVKSAFAAVTPLVPAPPVAETLPA